MANLLLASPEAIELATLTAGSAQAAWPAANLQSQVPSKRWRSATLSNAYIVADLGAAQAIDTIALTGHNLTGAAAWQIRGADTQANLTASPGYDSGSVSAWPATGKPAESWDGGLPSLLHLGAAETWRWWRVDLSDAGNAAGYLEAARLVVAGAWQPALNLQVGAIGPDWDDLSTHADAAGGQQWPLDRGRRRFVEFSLLSAADTDEMYDQAFELVRRRGRAKDVLFVLDPDDTKHRHRRMFCGLLRDLAPINLPNLGYHEKRFRIVEMV